MSLLFIIYLFIFLHPKKSHKMSGVRKKFSQSLRFVSDRKIMEDQKKKKL